MGCEDGFDLVVVNVSGIKLNLPYNVREFGCPTVAIVGDTHHGFRSPIGELLEYLTLETYDYLVFPYCRHHMHWFYACGFDNLGWLPLITMTTYSHEFVEQRQNKAVFICGDTQFHPQRHRVIESLIHSSLPVEIATLDRGKSAIAYAHALIALNCSLNGDISLRNLEIVSSGGFLLTDSLSPQSGFTHLLTPGQECDTYTSRPELLEKIAYYLEHPNEAIAMARRAYQKFYQQLHPTYRVNELWEWVLTGDTSSPFLKNHDSRMTISRQHAELLETRVAIYEQLQEVHRLREHVSILIDEGCPLIVAMDLVDLPRAKVYVRSRDQSQRQLVEELGLSHQIHWLDETNTQHGQIWDVYICQTLSPAVRSCFVIELDERHQMAYSGLAGLNKVVQLKLTSKSGASYSITYIDESGCQRVIREVLDDSCYPTQDFAVKDVHVIVDIGANIGIAAAYFRVNYPEAEIYCFEPDPFAFLLLQENARKLRKCHAFPFGLYSSDATRHFYLGESSVHSSMHPNPLAKRVTTVELKEASKFLWENGITPVDILKIDTEGCEVDILRNLSLLNLGVKVIYLEFHSESDRRVIDQLLSPHYILWQGSIKGGHRGNLCYIRRELCPVVPGLQPL